MLYMYLCGLDVHNAKNVQDKSFVLDSHLEIIVYVHACICMIVESDLCLYWLCLYLHKLLDGLPIKSLQQLKGAVSCVNYLYTS